MTVRQRSSLLALLLLPLCGELYAWRALRGLPAERLEDHWPLWTAIALPLVLLGAWYWRGRPAPPTPPDQRQGGGLACLALMALAAAYRLVALGRYPRVVDHDAGLNAVLGHELWSSGRLVAAHPHYGIEALFTYLLAGALEWGGVSLFVLRLPGALVGVLTVGALFLFARELFGRRTALLAALLCAVSAWPVTASRVPKHALLVPPAICAAYALLLRALREGRRRDYALAGLLVGLGSHTFTSYRHGWVVAWLFVALYGAIGRRAGFAPSALRRGLPWFAAGLLLPLLPVLRFALAEPWLYLGRNLAERSVLTEIAAGGGAWPVTETLGRTLSHFILLRITHDPGLGLYFGLLVGLALPLLLRWRDPRFLLLGLLSGTMLLGPCLARFQLTEPRRFMALLPVLYPLAAFSLLEFHAGLSGALRRTFGLAAVLLIGVLALRGGLAVADTGRYDDHKQAVLRAALELARAPDRAVYLPDRYADGLRELEFYLLHPRIQMLAENDPFTIGRDGPPRIVLLPDGTALADDVAQSLGQLHRETVHGLEFHGLPRTRLNELRQGAEPEARGMLHVPRTGLYRFRLPRGAQGDLLLDDVPLGLDRRPRTLVLSRGLAPYRLTARVRPLIDGAATPTWWTSAVRHGPFGAAALAPMPQFVPAEPVHLPVRRGTPPAARPPQDLAAGRDALYLAQGDSIQRILRRTLAPDPAWRGLFDAAGRPIEHLFTDEVEQRRVWSLSVEAHGGIVVAHRLARWVRRFDAGGRQTAELLPAGGWSSPADVAAGEDGRVAVADEQRGAVLLFDGRGRQQRAIRLTRPISLDWSGDRLVVLDAGRFSLLVLDGAGRLVASRFLGAVPSRSRIQVADGHLAVCLPVLRRVLLFDPALRLLCGDGGADAFVPGPINPLEQVLWEPARSGLFAADDQGRMRRFAQTGWPAGVDRLPGIELFPDDLAGGNLNREPTEFGAGLAIDGGVRPARGEFRIELPRAGRYQCWALFASGEPRPLVVELDGRTVLRPAPRTTGGFHRRDARWQILGELQLAAGPHRLALVCSGPFVHLACLKLMRPP